MSASRPTRLMVLWCPDWPIIAARSTEHESIPPATALALSSKGLIAHCSIEARARGVFPGQRVRDAQVNAPSLVVLADQPERDQRVWNTVLEHLVDTVARVAPVEPGMIAVRAAGLARYYGSEHQAAQALIAATLSCDRVEQVRVGIADTLFGAVHAARYGTGSDNPVCAVEPAGDADFLAPLPLRVLDSAELVGTLEKLGLATLADFATLDSQHVSERFGPAASVLHACARGVDPRSSQSTDIPPSTDRRWRSETPVSRSDALGFAVRDTVDDFVAGLVAQQAVCTSVRITLIDDRENHYAQVWSHPRFFTAADLVNRVRWQWESEARESAEEYDEGGIQEVVFEALSPDHLFGHEPGLWGGADPDTRIEHTIAHIQSRLGHQAVAHAHTQPGHRFEEREQLVAWGTSHAPVRFDLDDPHSHTPAFVGEIPRPLPATVFQPPTPVVLDDQSGRPLACDLEHGDVSGEPAVMRIGSRCREVVAWAGPWPVSERWWDRHHAAVCYRLQLLDREGVGWLVSHDPTAGHWQIEARYD